MGNISTGYSVVPEAESAAAKAASLGAAAAAQAGAAPLRAAAATENTAAASAADESAAAPEENPKDSSTYSCGVCAAPVVVLGVFRATVAGVICKECARLGAVPRHHASLRRTGVVSNRDTELAKILAAQEEGAACRRVGVTTGLRGVADLAPFRRLAECGMPLLEPSNPPLFEVAQSDAEFGARFRRACPWAERFDFAAHGLVVAGGAVAGFLMRADAQVADIDLWLVGHGSDEEALAAIGSLGDYLSRLSPLTVYRTAGCVTFVDSTPDHRPCPIQVILRRYSTLGEVIHGFDLGSSAVAWDGARVWLTALGALAAEHGINILNMAARRATYEKRLARYFSRGYGIVLPDLDMGSFRLNPTLPFLSVPRGYGIPPFLSVSRGDGIPRNMRGDGNIFRGVLLDAIQVADVESVSWAYEDADTPPYGDPAALLVRNIRATARGTYASACACAPYVAGMAIPEVGLAFDGAAIAAAVWRVLNTGTASLTNSLARLTLLLEPRLATEALAAMLATLAAARAILRGDGDKTAAAPSAPREKTAPPAPDLSGICEARAAALNAEPLKIPFKFKGVEDGTALNGPFVRAPMTLAEWYGPHYRGAPSAEVAAQSTSGSGASGESDRGRQSATLRQRARVTRQQAPADGSLAGPAP